MNEMNSNPRQHNHSSLHTIIPVPRLDTSSRDVLALIASFLELEEVPAFGRSCRAASYCLHTAGAWTLCHRWVEKWNAEAPWLYSRTFRVAIREVAFTLRQTFQSRPGCFALYTGINPHPIPVEEFSSVQIRILRVDIAGRASRHETELAVALSKLNLGALREMELWGNISQTCIQNLAVFLQPLNIKLKLRIVLDNDTVGPFDYVLSSDIGEDEAGHGHRHGGTDSSTKSSQPSPLSSSDIRGPTSCDVSQRVDNAVFLINIGGSGPHTPLIKAREVEISVDNDQMDAASLSNAISFFLNMLDATCLDFITLRNEEYANRLGIQLHIKPNLLARVAALDLISIRLLPPVFRKLPSCSAASSASASPPYSSSSSSSPSGCSSSTFSHFKRLVRVGMNACYLSASDFKALAAIPTLEELSAHDACCLKPEHLHALAGSPIKKLHLTDYGCGYITTSEHILGLKGLTRLTSLKLEVPTSVFGDWSALAGLPLRDLSLSSTDPKEYSLPDVSPYTAQLPIPLRLPSAWRLDHLILHETNFDLNTMYLAAIVDLPAQPRQLSLSFTLCSAEAAPRPDRVHAQQQRFWARLHAQSLTIDLMERMMGSPCDIPSSVLGGIAFNSHLQILRLKVCDPDVSVWMSELMEWFQIPETFPALKQLLVELRGNSTICRAFIETMPRKRPNLMTQLLD